MKVFRLIGGAGTGKTTELLGLLGKLHEHGIEDPTRVGFVSFTRAARDEAAKRTAEVYDVPLHELKREGWFRTIHSVCVRMLGNPEGILGDDADSRDFMRSEVSTDAAPPEGDEGFHQATPVQTALAIWGASRNRLESLETSYAWAQRCSPDVPPLAYVRSIAKKYEQAKLLHGKTDFVDLLLRVAGIRCLPEHGLSEITPRGEMPDLPVWFFDEQQDASALLDYVSRRLVSSDSTRFVYLVGDPFQSIYGFAGASSRHFLGWDVTAERTMPKSWRCPAPIHEFGERCLARCPDYWDRKIAPADHEGAVRRATNPDDVVATIDPRDSWLLLARTHLIAARWSRLLDERGIPWVNTHGGGGWAAPVRSKACGSLWGLHRMQPISGDDWATILKYIPTKLGDTPLLTRGTKSRFERPDERAAIVGLEIDELESIGATPALVEMIRNGRWASLVPNGEEWLRAVGRWGDVATFSSGVRVGTIHSVKGSEADNVAVLTASSARIATASDRDLETKNEERRVAYVAATRARRSLTIVDDYPRFAMDFPKG